MGFWPDTWSVSTRKKFLMISNFTLLVFGVLFMAASSKLQVEMLLLSPEYENEVDDSVGVITGTSVLITLGGLMGLCGTYYETLWQIIFEMSLLGLAVVLQFSSFCTVMSTVSTVQVMVEDPDCDKDCQNSLNYIFNDRLIPLACIMLVLIILEVMMILTAKSFYYYVIDKPKIPSEFGVQGTQTSVQLAELEQTVPPSEPLFPMGPLPPQYAAQPPYAPLQEPPVQFEQLPQVSYGTMSAQPVPGAENPLRSDAPEFKDTVVVMTSRT